MKLPRLGSLLAMLTLASVVYGQRSAHDARRAVSLQAGADFDALYTAVKAKHDAAFHDLYVDMKEWVPFAVKALRENDYSRFSSEQLLRLLDLGLFLNLPDRKMTNPLRRS